MKLLTWNSAMKFREKIKHVLPISPDVMVIPECEAPEKWKSTNYEDYKKQFLWFGDNLNKGIGIFSLSEEYRLELHPDYNPAYKYIIPITVSGKENFILFAIWTQNTKQQYYSYVGQLFMALEGYKHLLSKPCFIIGDWNSNKLFDYIKRVGTHTDVVKMLSVNNIYSVYHDYFEEEQGEESIATHYFRKDIESPFHIDYIFTSKDYLSRMKNVELGSYQDWIRYSDHMPIVVDFKLNMS